MKMGRQLFVKARKLKHPKLSNKIKQFVNLNMKAYEINFLKALKTKRPKWQTKTTISSNFSSFLMYFEGNP